MHLKQPFTKNKERTHEKFNAETQKFKETGDKNCIYKTELNKAYFQHDMAYGDFKYSARRTGSDKILRDKAFSIAKNPKYDGYQRGIASMVYKFFDKKSAGSGVNVHANNKIKQNQRPLDLAKHQLAEELHKPIIKKIKKRTVYSGFKDNIWGADSADMQLTNKFNKVFRFLLYVIDIFSKYAWVVPLKEKRGINIVDTFQKVLDMAGRKPNKTWVNKGSELYNNYFKKT